MTIARQVAWNTIAQALARSLVLLLSIATTVLLTRRLGVEGYGDFVTITVYVALFAVLFDWGITALLAREIAQRSGDAGMLMGKALGLRLLLALPVASAAAAIALAVYGGEGRTPVRIGIQVCLPVILFSAASNTLAALFQARLRMARFAGAELAGQAVTATVIALMIVADRGLYAIVAAVVAGAAVTALLAYLLAQRLEHFAPEFDAAFSKQLLVRALPLGLALLIATVYFRIDAVLLSLLKGSEDVGIYGVAYRFLEAVIPFPFFFVVSVFPPLAAAVKNESAAVVHDLTQRSFDALVLAAVPVSLGTIAVAPELVQALTGGGFARSVTPLRILIVGAGLTFLNALFAYVLIAYDRQKPLLAVSFGALVLNVAGNLAFIPSHGYMAAATVATISEAALLLGYVWAVRRVSGFVPSLRVGIRAAAAGLVMFAAVHVLDAPLGVSLVAAVVVYCALVIALRAHRTLNLRDIVARGKP